MAVAGFFARSTSSRCATFAIVACWWLPVRGLGQPLDGGSEQTKTIAGVPVYNYQRLKEQDKLRGSTNLRGGAFDWILMLHGSTSHVGVHEVCASSAYGLTCIDEGHPASGGVAFVTLRASEVGLSRFLHNHSDKVHFVEPDGPVFGAPEVPISKVFTGPSQNATLNSSLRAWVPWGLDRIDSHHGIDGSYSAPLDGGKGVHVYVADTGILTTHSDFGGRAIPTLEVLGTGVQTCWASDSTCARDGFGHGTHCAGIIGGMKWGVAKGVTLHAVKVLGDDNWGKYSWWIAALDWIATYGQRPAIISASLGGRGIPALVVAVDAVTAAGVTVVVSAGNENSDACQFMPSGIPSAITVGATGLDDHRASYSNFGPCVDIFAPGSRVISDYASSNTAVTEMSGTSMACPHVAGAVALLLQGDPTLQPPQIAARLTDVATAGVVKGLATNTPNLLLYVDTTSAEGGEAPKKASCEELLWPDVDHGLVCGECKVLVKNFSTIYLTCDRYCDSIKRLCTGAWEDILDTCTEQYQIACDQFIPSTDAICECGREAYLEP